MLAWFYGSNSEMAQKITASDYSGYHPVKVTERSARCLDEYTNNVSFGSREMIALGVSGVRRIGHVGSQLVCGTTDGEHRYIQSCLGHPDASF